MKSDLICNFESFANGHVCLSVTRDDRCIRALIGRADRSAGGMPAFVDLIDGVNVDGRPVRLTADWPFYSAGAYTLRQRMGRIFYSYPGAVA
jgi:hypothetical protein